MRRLLALCAVAVLLTGAAHASDIHFVRVWPDWRDSFSFKRISEYFNGREATDGSIVVRTQQAHRAGLYFLVRVDNRSAPLTGARFVVHIVRPDKPEPVEYTFPGDMPAGSRVFNLGLTGTDWPGQRVRPVAWMVELVDASGRPVANSQSFLWALPKK